MARVVYGLFTSEAATEPAIRELTRRCDEHPVYTVQSFTENPLRADHLPEAATEFGRNIMLSTVVGAIGGGILGLVCSAFITFPGFGPGLFTLFGIASGVVVAIYTVIMSGTRVAKEPLLELQTQLGEGSVLLVIETGSQREAELVADVLDDSGGDPVDMC